MWGYIFKIVWIPYHCSCEVIQIKLCGSYSEQNLIKYYIRGDGGSPTQSDVTAGLAGVFMERTQKQTWKKGSDNIQNRKMGQSGKLKPKLGKLKLTIKMMTKDKNMKLKGNMWKRKCEIIPTWALICTWIVESRNSVT